MATKPKGTVPHGLRWTIQKANQEFACAPATLRSRFSAGNIQAGADGCYSTAQIIEALYSSLSSEKLRLTREQADGHALDNEAKRGKLVPAIEVERALSTIFILIKGEILASHLDAAEQDSLLRHLADFDYLTRDGAQEIDPVPVKVRKR